MKRLISIILFCTVAFALAVPAVAVDMPYIDLDGDGINDYDTSDGTLNYYYLEQIQKLSENDVLLRNDVDSLVEQVANLSPSEPVSDVSDSSNSDTGESNPLDTSDMVLQSVEVYSVSPITPESTSGLKSVLISLIGNYDTIVTDYTYQSSNQYTQHSIDVQPDYVWFGSFLMLCLIIYCIFRLGGALIGLH